MPTKLRRRLHDLNWAYCDSMNRDHPLGETLRLEDLAPCVSGRSRPLLRQVLLAGDKQKDLLQLWRLHRDGSDILYYSCSYSCGTCNVTSPYLHYSQSVSRVPSRGGPGPPVFRRLRGRL